MKTIVTHISPDLDAILSCWLLTRFMPGWQDAQVRFVPAGTTLDGKPAESDPEIAHVDTGRGLFDHHQFKDDKLCAAKRVFDHLLKEGHIKKHDEEALTRIVDFACLIDNFKEAYFHDPTSDIYDFGLDQAVGAIKMSGKKDEETVQYFFPFFDGLVMHFKNKIRAEEEIEKGLTFTSKWGKTLAVESANNETSRLALKGGYDLVVRRDPKSGHIRIHTFPRDGLDLTPLHARLSQEEPEATWFLHVSTHMLLNGSAKNPASVPSKLPLQRVIEIIKEI